MSRLRVSAGGRWDAVVLLHDLNRFHPYLVQVDDRHWDLHLEWERDEDEILSELLSRVRRWLLERSLSETVVQAGGRTRVVRADPGGDFTVDLDAALADRLRGEPAAVSAREDLAEALLGRL